jgi:hypothetical protein
VIFLVDLLANRDWKMAVSSSALLKILMYSHCSRKSVGTCLDHLFAVMCKSPNSLASCRMSWHLQKEEIVMSKKETE